jgi:hypothetical protein
MNKAAKKAKRGRKRRLFDELMSGVKAMREHRESRLALRTHRRLVERAFAISTRAGPYRTSR